MDDPATIQPQSRPTIGDMPRTLLVAVAAGVGVIIGSFGPWVSVATAFGSLTVAGTEGDGQISMIAGVIATAIVVIRLIKPNQHIALTVLTAIAFIVATGVGVYHWMNIENSIGDIDNEFVRASVSWGIPLLTASGIIGAIVSALDIQEQRKQKPTAYTVS